MKRTGASRAAAAAASTSGTEDSGIELVSLERSTSGISGVGQNDRRNSSREEWDVDPEIEMVSQQLRRQKEARSKIDADDDDDDDGSYDDDEEEEEEEEATSSSNNYSGLDNSQEHDKKRRG